MKQPKLKIFKIDMTWTLIDKVSPVYVADFSADQARERAELGLKADYVSPFTLGEAKPSRVGLARCKYMPFGYLPWVPLSQQQ